jgi:hypothetical protein
MWSLGITLIEIIAGFPINYKPCKMITAKGKTRIGKGFLVAPNGDISKII